MRNKKRSLGLPTVAVQVVVSRHKRSGGVWFHSPRLVFALLTRSYRAVIDLSLVVVVEHKMHNFSLVVPIQLHPALLSDSVVRFIMVSMIKEESDVFIVVSLHTYIMSA